MMFRRAISSILALLIFVGMAMGSASAASVTSSGNGIRLSPIRFDLTINPGKSQTIQFRVQNITKTVATYKAEVTDFLANNQNGAPQLLVNNNKFDPYSIRQFIPSIPNITVQPGQIAQVKVTISIPAKTAGGGYFGAVRFLAVNPDTGKTVNIAASVAGLILLTVPGPGLNENMFLTTFNVAQNGQTGGLFYSGNNIEANARFDNTGNVQLPPFGKVVVKDMGGATIETKTINNSNPPGNILPGSYRTFNVPLTGIGSFGKYTVSGYFGYGNKGQLLSATTTFYVVAPWIIVLAVVILLLIIAAIIFAPRMFRAWYKRSVRKAKQ